jgi:hypothetical protein
VRHRPRDSFAARKNSRSFTPFERRTWIIVRAGTYGDPCSSAAARGSTERHPARTIDEEPRRIDGHGRRDEKEKV